MSDWELRVVNVEFRQKRATVAATRKSDNVHITLNNLTYDLPGKQDEVEIQKLVVQAARQALQDLIENPPNP